MLMDKMRIALIGLTLVGVAGLGVGTAVLPPVAAAPPAAPPPTYSPAPPASPGVANTYNFRVTAANARVAQLVADEAERQRKAQALLWFGKELPRWTTPCPIEVVLGVNGSGGATTFQFADGKVTNQSMRLEGPLERVLTSLVPHEVTHTVWAHAFGEAVPRWADEGAAILAEDREDQDKNGEVLVKLLDQPTRWIPLRRLFVMTAYPEDVMVLFAQGFSTTRFLVKRKDHPTFLRFVKDGVKNGWDQAAKEHYGFKNVEELEDAWMVPLKELQARRREEKAETPSTPVGSIPPLPGMARLSADGQFVHLRVPMTVYQPKTIYPTHSGPGQPTPRTFYQTVVHETTFVLPLDQIEVSHLNGDKVMNKELVALLTIKKELPVLVSMDGKKVDPVFLRVIKESTLILTPPAGRLHELQNTPPAAPTALPH